VNDAPECLVYGCHAPRKRDNLYFRLLCNLHQYRYDLEGYVVLVREEDPVDAELPGPMLRQWR
jgi:hypothetical protein